MLWTKSSRNSVGGGGLRAGLAGKATLEQTKTRTSPVSDWQRQRREAGHVWYSQGSATGPRENG